MAVAEVGWLGAEGGDVLKRAPSAVAAGARLATEILVGRDEQLADVLRLVTTPPAVVAIEGEAGIGKTRLVEELLRQPALRTRTRLVGSCQALPDPFFLGPVLDALRHLDAIRPGGMARRGGRLPAADPRGAANHLSPLTGLLRPLLPELAAQLPPAPDAPGDARAYRHLLFRALLEVVGSVGPAVLVLEDVHWADDATAGFIRYAAAQLPRSLALVVTYRREDMPDSSPILAAVARPPSSVSGARIEVGALTPSEVGSLIRALLNTAEVSDQFAALVHERTAGIPFAVEEFMRLARDRRDLVAVGGRWLRRSVEELGVPRGIRDTVLERASRLDPEARRVLHAAAVLGSAHSADLISATTGLERARAATGLARVVGECVLFEVEPARYGFRHALARDAVYDAIAGPEREELHLNAARTLETRSVGLVAAIAEHYRRAGHVDDWLRFAELAAMAATDKGDHGAAARTLRAVLLHPELDTASRGRVAVALARSAVLGMVRDAELLRMLAGVADDRLLAEEVRGELRIELGLLLNIDGDSLGSYRQWTRAVDELDTRPDLAATVMTLLAAPLVLEGHVTEHLHWLERARETAARQDDPEIRDLVERARGPVLVAVGDPGGWDAADLVMRRDGSAGRHRIDGLWDLTRLAFASFHLGHLDRARRYRDEARRRHSELGYDLLQGAIDAVSYAIDWRSGEWSDLLEAVGSHAERTADVPDWAAAGILLGGLLRLARGETELAEQILRDGWSVSRETALIPGMAMAASGLGRMRLDAGAPDLAWEEIGRGLDVIEAKGVWAWGAWIVPTAVEALLALDRVEEATALVERLATGIRGRDAPAGDGAVHLCRGLLAERRADLDLAAREYATAACAYRRFGCMYEGAQAAFRAGAVLLASGDRTGAERVREVLSFFEAIGAEGDAARTRRLLRQHEVRVPRPWLKGRAGYGTRLSPRQQAVVELVAQGRTNPQIARTLYLSSKTVEHHVGAAMQKLGVSSRTALAARWAAMGATAPAGQIMTNA